MAQDWDIKRRAEACSKTQRPFEDGESFYTLLFHDKDGFRREDLSEDAWTERNENIQPFSFWRSKFEPPEAAPPETLPKSNAEELLRRYMGESDATHENARYILALMLERKRVFKQIDARETESARHLVYEHSGTGEVFVIRDPELHLDQLASVQTEIANQLE